MTWILGLNVVSLVIWLGLILGWGRFWYADQRLTSTSVDLEEWPTLCVVIPARNEADLLPQTLQSLLTQTYPGLLKIILVDDQSTDDTATIAEALATEFNQTERFRVIQGQPLKAGWTGKLWALEQGIQAGHLDQPRYWLLTDADIYHDANNIKDLVVKAVQERLDLVSLMVLLRCESVWERLLIPAFVFFFQKLYPFPWVNDPKHPIAAAAGGCILIRSEALTRIGGIASLREALIDDCTLAQAVKSTSEPTSGFQGIWLGLTEINRSVRPYPSLESVWRMVARTAYTQLQYSPLLLIGTLIGMMLIYGVAPISFCSGIYHQDPLIMGLAATTWILMAMAYAPTLQLYRLPLWFGLALPGIACLYTLMTLDSARQHWQGQGGQWKDRVYSK